MARYEPIEGWPGSILFRAAHGRIYCAAPRGLIPAHPYSIDALRPPNAREAKEWGSGVLPRMVVDVTVKGDFRQAIRRRTLSIAPWNAYLVLRLPHGAVIVAYSLGPELPRLDKTAASQVAIASGYDVAGWSSQVISHYGGERWHFAPPNWEAMPRFDPQRSASTN
jgi:hypothetical protein